MKKVSIVTLKTYEQESLRQLRDLGVLHVFSQPGEAENADSLREQYAAIERALTAIPVPDGGDSDLDESDGDAAVDNALKISEGVQRLLDERSLLTDELDRLRREVERFAPWGDPLPEKIAALKEHGVDIRLYEITPDNAEGLKERLPNPIEFSRTKFIVRFVSVALKNDRFPEDVIPVDIPERSIAGIEMRIDEIDTRTGEIDAELESLSDQRPILNKAISQLEKDFEFARVAASMDSEKELSWITGFVPIDIIESVRTAAGENGWGVVIREPEPDEQVPTKIDNPKPIGIIKPVFDLLGTVPGYREMDISFFFLLFFIVFFAMIIGDGAYGVILLVGTIYFAVRGKRQGKQPGPGTALMLVLSAATVVWGAVTGNWFGYKPFNQLPILKDLMIPAISVNNEQADLTVQYMCFVIGTIHLSIAHVWNFIREIRRKPMIAALAQLGWLSMVLGLYYLVLQMVLDPQRFPMPTYAGYMIAIGLGAVIIFGEQKEGSNFFVGVGRGLAGLITTALDGVSAFSDIISYIRLFAVGLASLAIAQAFNGMAMGIAGGLGGAGGAVAAAVVLFLGHTLNLAMAALSVVVHGVRLNMLEFSQHLGMEWSGVEYAPFKTR